MERTAPHSPLTGRDNRTVKFLASLGDPKVRKKEQAFLIEGVKMVEEALRDGLGVKHVIATPSLTQHHGKGVIKLAERRGIDILWISERLMDQLAESKTPQPVMALMAMREHSAEELLNHASGLIVLAHELQDPGNLGTIIRTAEAVGAAGVAITPRSVDPHHPKTLRATVGSILRLPVVKITDERAFLERCRTKGFQTVAMVLNGERMLFELDLTRPTAVIVGQEGAGLQGALLDDVDLRIRIPMAGTIDSLNAAVSAAVFLYETYRQRMNA